MTRGSSVVPVARWMALAGITVLATAWGGGCAERARWTEAAALSPTLVRLDTDHDGRVGEGEYARVAWESPPFATVDGDGDGAFSAPELATMLDAQNPHTFDGAARRGSPDPELGPGMSGAMTTSQRHAWEVLHVLAAEAAAAGSAVPGDAAIDAAAADGLDGPAARQLRVELHAAWVSRGLAFPERLRASP